MSINFYTDADRIGAGEFVEGVVTLATQFTVTDGQIDYCRWPFPTVTPGTLPFMKVYSGAGSLLATIAFDTTTLDAWNSATPGSPIVVSAGTIKVAVITPRYTARTGFFSGGSITRSGITAVQGLFTSGDANPTSTSTASYLADLGFTASGGSAVTVIDLAGGLWYRSAVETPVFGILVPDAVGGLRARSAVESVGSGIVAQDPPGGVRLRAGTETILTGVLVGDLPIGLRARSGIESVATGLLALDLASGMRLGVPLANVLAGLVVSDTPGGLRARSATESVSVGSLVPVSVADLVSGLRLGAPSASAFIQQPSTELPVAPILALVPTVRFAAPVSRTSIVVEVKEVRA